METKKYIINITKIEDIPTNWASRNSWESEGIFYCKKESAFYCITEHSVSYIGKVEWMMETQWEESKVNNAAEVTPSVTESLFLRAIAAASRAETLK